MNMYMNIYKYNPLNYLTKDLYISSIDMSVDGKFYGVRVEFADNFLPVFDKMIEIHPKGFFAQLFGEHLPLHVQNVLKTSDAETCVNIVKRLSDTPLLFIDPFSSAISEDVISVAYGSFKPDKEYWLSYNGVPLHEVEQGADNYKPSSDAVWFSIRMGRFLERYFGNEHDIEVGFCKLGSDDLLWKNMTAIREEDRWRFTTRKNEKVRKVLAENIKLYTPDEEVGLIQHDERDPICYIRRCIAKNEKCTLWITDKYKAVNFGYVHKYKHEESELSVRYSMDRLEVHEKLYQGLYTKFIDVPENIEPIDLVHPSEIEFRVENDTIVAEPESVEVYDVESYRMEEDFTAYFFRMRNKITGYFYGSYVATAVNGRIFLLHEEDPLRRKAVAMRELYFSLQ